MKNFWRQYISIQSINIPFFNLKLFINYLKLISRRGDDQDDIEMPQEMLRLLKETYAVEPKTKEGILID